MKDDLNTHQVAEYLGCNYQTAKRLMRKVKGAYKVSLTGEAPAKNSPWRVSLANLRDWLNRNKYAVGSRKMDELEARGYCNA